MRETARERLVRMTLVERIWWAQGILPGGVDEVGRGPLAGPVVAACVVMPQGPLLEWVNDSKKVTKLRREKLYDEICACAVSWAVAQADVQEIDGINIREASRLAMVRAINEANPAVLLSDAEGDLAVDMPQKALVHGDTISYVIAAASIVAKVHRDRLMLLYDEEYPQYGFAQHKGYGTKQHIEALKKHGPCPLHRRLFIRNFV